MIDAFDESEVMTTCALRIDGHAYARDGGRELRDLVETCLRQGPAGLTDIEKMAAFFALQRFLLKWGGEQLPRTGREWRAFRELFLEVCWLEPPAEYSPSPNARECTERWDKCYKPRLPEVVHFVRQIHMGTAYR